VQGIHDKDFGVFIIEKKVGTTSMLIRKRGLANIAKPLVFIGSPCATLFITVLFLPELTENLQYQRVIKDQAAPDEAEAVLNYISFTILSNSIL